MTNSSVWQALKNKLPARGGSLLGVDIGTGSVKIVEIERTAVNAIVKNIAIADFDAAVFEDGRLVKPEELTAILQRQIAASGFNSRQAVAALGGRSMFVREITVPPMTETELREAVKWEAVQYLPYAPDRCYYDFALLGSSVNEAGQKVLLAAAPRETIDILTDVLTACDLQPVAIDGEAFALYRTLSKAENSLFLDIGRHLSQIILYQHGVPVATRLSQVAGKRFTEVIVRVLKLGIREAEQLKRQQENLLAPVQPVEKHPEIQKQMLQLVQELVQELRQTVEFYQSRNTALVVDKIIVGGGGGAVLSNFLEQFKVLLNVPVVFHTALAAIEYAPVFDAGTIRATASRLAVAAGLALRGADG